MSKVKKNGWKTLTLHAWSSLALQIQLQLSASLTCFTKSVRMSLKSQMRLEASSRNPKKCQANSRKYGSLGWGTKIFKTAM